MDWTARLQATFGRIFPERQIYHRSGGKVHFITLHPAQQAMIAVGAVLLAAWTVTSTASFAINAVSAVPGDASAQEVRKLKRWNEELRAQNATMRDAMQHRRTGSEKMAASWEARQETLESIVEALQGGDVAGPAEADASGGEEETALRGSGSDLLVRASIDEADPRQSRTSLDRNTLLLAGDRGAHFRRQEELLNEIAALSAERTEQARSILRLTGVSDSAFVPDMPAMGGPFIPLSDEGYGPSGERFSRRAFEVSARVAEMRHSEILLGSLPLHWPIGGTRPRVTSNFGVRTDPISRRPGWHEGLDMASSYNAPILAAGPGKVIYAGSKRGYGNTVEIDHGSGFMTRYAHMRRKLKVSVGDYVETGDPVGTQGSSGRSTGDHLHYEVHVGSKVYNPAPFMKAGQHVREQ